MNVEDKEAHLLVVFTAGGLKLMLLYGSAEPKLGSAPTIWDADSTAEVMAGGRGTEPRSRVTNRVQYVFKLLLGQAARWPGPSR
jgi:hypothetical protein